MVCIGEMPSNKSVSDEPITQFINCRILRHHKLQREDLWVRGGKILDPEKLFFDEEGFADYRIDCENRIIAPGFIDVQINGGYGIDFSQASDDYSLGIAMVAKKLLQHGVTSFCPTIVTSPPAIYQQVLPQIRVQNGGPDGAGILGVHLEGPFISKEKKGAHPPQFIRSFNIGAIADLLEIYGQLDNVTMVTLAPELPNSGPVIQELARRGIIVSLGHSVANLSQAEAAVLQGSTFITHLFNAMLPFHHRDPGIVGLLTSEKVPAQNRIFYGMIADGIHTHPAALRIAHRAHPKGLVLVTDAVPAMGLPAGCHSLGQQEIHIDGLHAYVAGVYILSLGEHESCHELILILMKTFDPGTTTLSGSIATMDMCVRHFRDASGCSEEAALEAASLHPAELLNLTHCKGTLDYGSDADFVVLDESFTVRETYIAGQQVWKK
ncbi:N-acetylglucosamine-6-phosphate deacetylase isoform X1 [Denticeps clupeoides]|uniref:N-acetylglucosamine-6-phosphate deacetylase isoform X1 n=2 Tax=Denticeps clupeoides TaxID=299321 RepID=UPI0010A2C6AE|nr:N-acetylglucosamine-6-phosphate deacetylase isoform X1 [Denticeps clupeoides]